MYFARVARGIELNSDGMAIYLKAMGGEGAKSCRFVESMATQIFPRYVHKMYYRLLAMGGDELDEFHINEEPWRAKLFDAMKVDFDSFGPVSKQRVLEALEYIWSSGHLVRSRSSGVGSYLKQWTSMKLRTSLPTCAPCTKSFLATSRTETSARMWSWSRAQDRKALTCTNSSSVSATKKPPVTQPLKLGCC
jgi:hypothetical protein